MCDEAIRLFTVSRLHMKIRCRGRRVQSISCFLPPIGSTITAGICVASGCYTKVSDEMPEEVRDEVQDLWPATAREAAG